ncbi:hypothetical protein [Haliangium ochraceum]|uniref:Uncharacterized protein n=1 Tax=Haliangium ochraceum (strain DSM 14365 / JCM 11303 / SMP-2) TaxID=502025 RepID=D0LUY2_HALO1|nr:hypothetical protein [Haliangium ochraceum]ACY14022.1 hypothetical protein Hoch_1469 [Haliangium ochraceum DSM 14365]
MSVNASYDDLTATLTLPPFDIKGTTATGSFTLSENASGDIVFSGSLRPRPQDGPVPFSGEATAPVIPLSTWQNVYETDTKFWGGFFSPLIVFPDGSVTVDGVAITTSYDDVSATLELTPFDIKGTTATGAVSFTDASGIKEFSGSLRPRPQDGPVPFSGVDIE